VAVAQERENWMHAFWRRRQQRPFPALTAPERAEPLLDHWRSSVTRHGSSPIEVVDPTQRNLGAAIQEAQNSPNKFV